MEIPIIERETLKNLIEKKENYILIDVRNKDELQHGVISTSNNLPLPELEESFNLSNEDFKNKYNFNKFTKSSNIIFYCKSGGRSKKATQLALENGFHAQNYSGSIWEWSQFDSNVKRYGVSFIK